jgi:hypothetical protein
VLNEAEEGKRRAIVAPALLENVTIPLGFRHLQAANLSDWQPASTHPEFNQLVESITRILSAPSAVPTTATSREPVIVDRKVTDAGSPIPGVKILPGTRSGLRSRKIKAALLIIALGVLIASGVALTLKWQDENAVRDLIGKMRESAEAGLVENQYQLAEYYSKGEFVTKDDAEAMKWYRMAADNGHASAQYYVANRYAKGQGVPKDDREAMKWYRKAAEQGHVVAQYYVGDLYAEGRGVPQDDAEAARWYRKAAEQGDREAQKKLGARYALGQGLKKDEAAAAHWLRKAADQGDAEAQTLLGFMYADGRGVPEDDAEALKWWRSAAKQGEPAAQKQLKKYGLTW